MADTPVPPQVAAPGLRARTAAYLRSLFSGNNLTQASTIQGLIHFVSATGLVVMTPGQEQQAADSVTQLVAATMQWLAALQYALATAKFLYNERKHIIVSTISTAAPHGPATVEEPK